MRNEIGVKQILAMIESATTGARKILGEEPLHGKHDYCVDCVNRSWLSVDADDSPCDSCFGGPPSGWSGFDA